MLCGMSKVKQSNSKWTCYYWQLIRDLPLYIRMSSSRVLLTRKVDQVRIWGTNLAKCFWVSLKLKLIESFSYRINYLGRMTCSNWLKVMLHTVETICEVLAPTNTMDWWSFLCLWNVFHRLIFISTIFALLSDINCMKGSLGTFYDFHPRRATSLSHFAEDYFASVYLDSTTSKENLRLKDMNAINRG